MPTAHYIGGAIGIAALITVATTHPTAALRTGARPASALSDGFSAAFHVEAGIIAAPKAPGGLIDSIRSS